MVIDDDEDVLVSANLLLKQIYSNIITQNNPRDINRLVSTQHIDLVILDMNYRVGYNDGKEGIHVLKHLLEINPDLVVVLMTAFGEVELAVNAIKLGAFDFLLKPWPNDKFLATVEAGIELSRSNQKLKQAKLSNDAPDNEDLGPVIGSSEPMQRIMQTINKVSNTMADVLILGENGTGKQHLAREIHRLSDRRNKPFIHVDLGSLTESIFESELFGYKQGAFTDAKEDRAGKFEAASGGTLFLDEIGNLSLQTQAKLLSAIQNKTIVRVGSNKSIPVNIRLVCATNENLDQMVADGLFREDLLYRINTIRVEVPPLRERGDDILILADFYLKKFISKYGKQGLRINQAAQEKLMTYSWPGNVRELLHTIERAVILSEGNVLKPEDFLLNINKSISSDSGPETLEEMELLMITNALAQNDGNYSAAAEQLGISRQTLYNKMKKVGR